ncbi:hypothetical protein TNCV_1475051 [Trichonephila clavipes]|nr:hypothetical protein TNCV_1475051 [Trichonephila clavipes]
MRVLGTPEADWTGTVFIPRGTYGRLLTNLSFRLDLVRNSLLGYDEEESNDKEYNSKYDSSTEIDPELEEGDTVEKKCFMSIDTETFGKNVILMETTGTHLIHFQMNF